jgi:nifR3 family TIM-barrel protein
VRFEDTAFFIGPHRISPATLAAPMAAISNPPFRAACIEHGCGLATTEMVAAQRILHPRIWRRKPPFERAEGERVLHVQLFGKSAAVLADGARAAADHGADVIDLNLGCPARKVVGSGSGAALGRDPRVVAEVVGAVVAAVGIPVTAKIRAGWDEASVNAAACARAAADAGASAITVHPRTRAAMFRGRADRSVLAEVVAAVSIPVVGNGDVRSHADAEAMVRETGCAAVMIGRGALGRPWVFRSLRSGEDRDPGPEERREVFRRYVARYVLWAGEDRAVREIRKHLLWFIRGVRGAALLRVEAQRVASAGEVEALLDRVLCAEPDAPADGGRFLAGPLSSS